MYALILKSDQNNPNYWICYQIANDLTQVESVNCYSPVNVFLPKENYEAELVKEFLSIPSCRTGANSEFSIYKFEDLSQLKNQFNFS